MKALRLGDYCFKIGSGATPRGGKDSYLDVGPYSLIRSQNVYNERFSPSGIAYISEDQAEALSNVSVEPNDVLVNITGDSVARVCQVDPTVLPARVNQHVAIVRPDPAHIEPAYLRYWLVSWQMQQHLLALASAGATRPALTKGMLETLPFPDIDIKIQRRSAAVLSALDDKIDLNRRMNVTLEAQARALFRNWFVDFGPVKAKLAGGTPYLAPDLWSLFPDRLGDGDVPEEWSRGRLDQIIDFNPREKLPKGTKASYLDMASLPTQGSCSDAPIRRAFGSGSKFRNGDALLARITPCLENGKAAYVDGLPNDAVGWGSTEFIVMRSTPPVPPQVAYLLARDPELRGAAVRSMSGTSGRQRASVDVLAAYPIAFPADERIWSALGEFLAPMFNKIRANAKENRTLAQTRDLLLPKLMSGEIRVGEAAEELAGELF